MNHMELPLFPEFFRYVEKLEGSGLFIDTNQYVRVFDLSQLRDDTE